jgi:hypothetical protein
MSDVGTRYVQALAAKDTAALLGLFAPDISFRGMTPGRFWEALSPHAVVEDVLYSWFEPSDVIEQVERVDAGSVADRERIDYQFRVRNDDGLFAVEQRAYFDLDADGLIVRMHAICAGFRPIGDTDGGPV